MFWHLLQSLGLTLLLFHSTYSFPRGKITEKTTSKPHPSKHMKPPQHISDFTDPNTGLNPFLDLEEGPTSLGRSTNNVMEDEMREEDIPYFDLVEGDAPSRRWGFDEPKQPLERTPTRLHPIIGNNNKDDVEPKTVPTVMMNLPTTELIQSSTKSTEILESKVDKSKETRPKITKEEMEPYSKTVVYASASVSVVVAIILLAGACWWKKKMKRLQASSAVQNGRYKS